MKKNLKKAVVLLLALVMALTPVQAFAVEKRYFYLSNTSQTRISMGAHDLDTNYQVIVADKKSATVQKVRYTVEDHGSDGYYYYLLPKKPGKPKITIKTTEGSGLLNWQFLKCTKRYLQLIPNPAGTQKRKIKKNEWNNFFCCPWLYYR